MKYLLHDMLIFISSAGLRLYLSLPSHLFLCSLIHTSYALTSPNSQSAVCGWIEMTARGMGQVLLGLRHFLVVNAKSRKVRIRLPHNDYGLAELIATGFCPHRQCPTRTHLYFGGQ